MTTCTSCLCLSGIKSGHHGQPIDHCKRFFLAKRNSVSDLDDSDSFFDTTQILQFLLASWPITEEAELSFHS
jgi:hypothetical protein